LKYGDRVESSVLGSGALALTQIGMPELGVLVILTSIVFPLLTIGGMVYLLLPLRLGFQPPGKTAVWRMVRALNPWSLIGVFMLGLLVMSSAAIASFDPAVLWPLCGPHSAAAARGASAAEIGYAVCHTCDL